MSEHRSTCPCCEQVGLFQHVTAGDEIHYACTNLRCRVNTFVVKEHKDE